MRSPSYRDAQIVVAEEPEFGTVNPKKWRDKKQWDGQELAYKQGIGTGFPDATDEQDVTE
jgi:hypothetical protein